MKKIASYLPEKWRGAVYSVLGTVTALELIWGFMPTDYSLKMLGTLNVLGFGMAALNTEVTEVAQTKLPFRKQKQ